MDEKRAVELLIVFACCSAEGLFCDDCPRYAPSDDEDDLRRLPFMDGRGGRGSGAILAKGTWRVMGNKEYIERGAALLAITNDGCTVSNVGELMDVPTADVVEVRHGEWRKRGNEKTCSNCAFIYYSNNDDWNYCPNCGATMDGKDDEA